MNARCSLPPQWLPIWKIHFHEAFESALGCRFIRSHREDYRPDVMRRIQEVPVGGDHRWQRRPICNRTQKDALLGRQDVQQRHKQPYGAPRLHAMRAEGLQVSRKRVARLMRSCGLQAKGKRRWVRAADSHHTFPVCPGLLDRQFEVEQPNRVRASESTLQRHSNVTGGRIFVPMAASSTASLLQCFATYYRPHRRLFVVNFVCAVASGLLELAFPIAVQVFVDQERELERSLLAVITARTRP